MTLSGHQRRRSSARSDRWLLALATLVLAFGVVVMHSLGTGHHGPSALATGGPSTLVAGAVSTHDVHAHTPVAGARSLAGAGHGEGIGAHHNPSSGVSDKSVPGGQRDSAGATWLVATASAATATVVQRATQGARHAMSHGATAMCLAVLPLLVLLRRRSGAAWFARVAIAARRGLHSPSPTWSARPPRQAGSILAELCILRT